MYLSIFSLSHAQIVLYLACGKSFKLASVYFWQVLFIFWVLPFWGHKYIYISGSRWTLTAATQESAILKESSFLLSGNGRLSFEVDIMEVNHVLKHTS